MCSTILTLKERDNTISTPGDGFRLYSNIPCSKPVRVLLLIIIIKIIIDNYSRDSLKLRNSLDAAFYHDDLEI